MRRVIYGDNDLGWRLVRTWASFALKSPEHAEQSLRYILERADLQLGRSPAATLPQEREP